MFSQVSVCPWGVSIPLHAGIHNWDQRQTSPLGRHPLADTLLCSARWDMVNKWAVRIPLECILVSMKISMGS